MVILRAYHKDKNVLGKD